MSGFEDVVETHLGDVKVATVFLAAATLVDPDVELTPDEAQDVVDLGARLVAVARAVPHLELASA